MNPIFAGFWYLFGFTTALFLISEIKGPWALITFVAAFVFRYILQRLVFDTVFGREISMAQSWANAHPVSAQFWNHAKAWATGHHAVRDPRQCTDCVNQTPTG